MQCPSAVQCLRGPILTASRKTNGRTAPNSKRPLFTSHAVRDDVRFEVLAHNGCASKRACGSPWPSGPPPSQPSGGGERKHVCRGPGGDGIDLSRTAGCAVEDGRGETPEEGRQRRRTSAHLPVLNRGELFVTRRIQPGGARISVSRKRAATPRRNGREAGPGPGSERAVATASQCHVTSHFQRRRRCGRRRSPACPLGAAARRSPLRHATARAERASGRLDVATAAGHCRANHAACALQSPAARDSSAAVRARLERYIAGG